MKPTLQEKTCFMCGFKFKVIDPKNWVCNNCYYHEIPKYTIEARRKKLKNISFSRFELKDPELIALIVEEAREKGKGKTQGEKKYRDFICESLRENGTKCITELKCENGRIDIFIDGVEILPTGRWRKVIKIPPKIIEVKINDSGSHLTSALGQLLFYSQSYPHAQLYIATPQHLNQKVRRIFGLYNIEEWAENKTEAWKEDYIVV